MKAIEFFMTAVKHEKVPKKKEMLRTKVGPGDFEGLGNYKLRFVLFTLGSRLPIAPILQMINILIWNSNPNALPPLKWQFEIWIQIGIADFSCLLLPDTIIEIFLPIKPEPCPHVVSFVLHQSAAS